MGPSSRKGRCGESEVRMTNHRLDDVQRAAVATAFIAEGKETAESMVEFWNGQHGLYFDTEEATDYWLDMIDNILDAPQVSSETVTIIPKDGGIIKEVKDAD